MCWVCLCGLIQFALQHVKKFCQPSRWKMFSKSAKRSKHATKITPKKKNRIEKCVCFCPVLFWYVAITCPFVCGLFFMFFLLFLLLSQFLTLSKKCANVCLTDGRDGIWESAGFRDQGVRGYWLKRSRGITLPVDSTSPTPLSRSTLDSWQVEHAAKCLLVPLSSANICVIRILKPTGKNVFVSRQKNYMYV